MQNSTTDQQIIAKVLSGNRAAYAELVKRHQRFVFTLALRFCSNRQDAEEIAQDCFVKAYRALGDFKGGSKFSTWLYSIAYTTAMTHLRRKKLDTRSIDDDNYSNDTMEFSAGDNICLAQVKLRSVYIDRAITLLAPADAAVIILFYQGEQSLDEIGVALGLESNAVKVRLFRARQRFKEKLELLLKHEAAEL